MTANRQPKRRASNQVAFKEIKWIAIIVVAIAVFATTKCSGRQQETNHISGTEPISASKLMEVEANGYTGDYEMLNYTGMQISFNPTLHIPNWVAWELTAEEAAGEEPRSQSFTADYNATGSASPSDYTNSGFDRGHMAPAGDMKWSQKAMDESFMMTNICPQAPELNRGSWKKLEEKCRLRAMRDSAIIIVCGPVLTDHLTEHIGRNNKVAVPRRFFKVILSPYSDPPTAIGFVMDNGAVKGGMQQAAMSVDRVEEITGLDFFSALPDSIENIVESQCNFHRWSQMK